jgi:hypothetical protein
MEMSHQLKNLRISLRYLRVDAPNSVERGWTVVIVVRKYAIQSKELRRILLVMRMKNAKRNVREIYLVVILAPICVINAKMEICLASLK